MSVGACGNAESSVQTRWWTDPVRFSPADHADQALIDAAGDRYAEVDRRLNQLLCSDLSPSQREQVYRYLEDLSRAWERCQGEGQTYSDIREQFGGYAFGADGFPEHIADYSNAQFQRFIELASITLDQIQGDDADPTGSCQGYLPDDHRAGGRGSPSAWAAGSRSLIEGMAASSSAYRCGDSGDGWISDPGEVLRRYEQDPAGFTEALREMSDEDRMLAMFSLQRAAQINSQIMQMVSNLLSSFHDSSMAVVRNLKA